MYEICKSMLKTIMSIEDYYDTIQDLQDEYANLLDKMQNTINCPSNWRNIKERLQEEYKDNSFAMEIIGEW